MPTRKERVTKICPNCGKPFSFYLYETWRKFCSRSCSNAYHANPTTVKVCPTCGKEFLNHGYDNEKFCSHECFLVHLRRKPHTCPQCSKTFVPKRHTDQKYCSPECQGIARQTRVVINCETCGKEIIIIQALLGRKRYCSKKCQMLSMFSSCEEREVIKTISNLLDELPIVQYTCSWLTNPKTDRPLYVDAYFPQHNLAVEYDGKQHREFMPFYCKTKQQFLELQERDRVKESLLQQYSIPLLRVTDKEPRTEAYIALRLNKILKHPIQSIQPQLPNFCIPCGSHS